MICFALFLRNLTIISFKEGQTMAAKKSRKSTRKAAPKRKVAKRKVSVARVSKASAVKKTIKITKPTLGKKAFSKSQITAYIAECCGLKKSEASAVLEALKVCIEAHLDRRGPGEFNLPGLLKCRVVRKPATKARKGINPFTGEPTVFKAKPARNVVKIRPLKKLKEAAA
jgi:nucleoid DNA-binding protein